MSSHLYSARSCLEHARMRVRELEEKILKFSQLPPYAEVEEDDPEPGWRVRKVKITTSVPRIFSHIAFDAANQLRAALDQAGYSVAVADGKSGKNAHFPFGDTPAEVTSRKTSGAKEIPSQIFALMESFSPYKGGSSTLWGLNKLCNANKHEVTLAPVIKPGPLSVGRGVAVGPAEMPNLWDGQKNELILFRVGPGGSVNNKFSYSFFVQIGDPAHILDKSAVQFLDESANDIEQILNHIDAEALSMGLFT